MFLDSLIQPNVIIALSIIFIIIYYFYSNNKVENFDTKDDYRIFFDTITSSKLNLEDRCKLSKQKIQDKKDGLPIPDQVINAANKFINDECSGNKKDHPKININPKDNDAILQYYNNYCLKKYGELGKTVNFDSYRIEQDNKGTQYFNGTPINKLELSKENCRRLEEYNTNMKNKNKEKPLSIDTVYNECLDKYTSLNDKAEAYTYYLSRDGKYYLNNEPLERIQVNKNNCTIIQDIMNKDKTDGPTSTLGKLNEEQQRIVCKRSNELDLICSVYDKNKVIEYGKNHEKKPVLYQYEISPEKYEYSFLKPDEYQKINKNIYKGRSGLTADNEIDVCYRKHVIGSECDAITVRNDI